MKLNLNLILMIREKLIKKMLSQKWKIKSQNNHLTQHQRKTKTRQMRNKMIKKIKNSHQNSLNQILNYLSRINNQNQTQISQQKLLVIRTFSNFLSLLTTQLTTLVYYDFRMTINFLLIHAGFWGFGEIGRASCRERV